MIGQTPSHDYKKKEKIRREEEKCDDDKENGE
jgi:hypothetical protein